MTAEPTLSDQDLLLERLAMQVGMRGLGRLESRIFAAMALSEIPRATIGELVERLGASKSHVSVSLRRLVELGWIDRVPVFGSRRDYYELMPDGVIGTYLRGATEISALLDVLNESVESLPESAPADHALRAYRDFMAVAIEEMDSLVARITQRLERGEVPGR